MTRKIKFSLNFNNQSVRTIEEFKEHVDINEAVECFKDSRITR